MCASRDRGSPDEELVARVAQFRRDAEAMLQLG